MRKPIASVHLLIAMLALVVTLGATRVASADDRADARMHYLAGQSAYTAGDYKTAIHEFGAAQQLMPADLNSYNLALCYDKLGDAEPAVQYYREYLSKVPGTDKRGEIEASIARLDAAARSAAAKRADDQRRADDARRAEEQRRADDQRRIEESRRPPEPVGGVSGGVAPAPVGPPPTPYPAPTTGGAPTGDAQLDRVQSIDITQIRNQRGATSMGTAGTGPAVAANEPNAAAANPGAPGPNGVQPNATPGAPAVEVETPVYKKWWFWAVVGVSLYVVYEIATENSSSTTARQTPLVHGGPVPQAPQGLTLLRW